MHILHNFFTFLVSYLVFYLQLQVAVQMFFSLLEIKRPSRTLYFHNDNEIKHTIKKNCLEWSPDLRGLNGPVKVS